MNEKKAYKKPSIGNERETAARQRLLDLFQSSPIEEGDVLTNLGLYTRSVVLAKYLYLNELYQQILDIPGVIMEFGVWWGANMSLLTGLRSVYEPYHWTRKIIGFDTFEGYAGVTPIDGSSEYVSEGAYAVPRGYEGHLAEVLDAHEQDNVNHQVKKHEIIKGDVVESLDRYLKDHPETIIALAYFDLGLFEPTRHCLEAIRPYLVKGSILAMDELNLASFPGETVALREVLGLDTYQIRRSRFLPDRSMVVIQ